MNKIWKITLAALFLVTLLLSTAACGMESMTGFTRLRDHLVSLGACDGKVVVLDTPSESYALDLDTVRDADGAYTVRATAHLMLQLQTGARTEAATLTLTFNGSTDKATLLYQVTNNPIKASAPLYLNHYTGEELIEFTEFEGTTSTTVERQHREVATDLCNTLLSALDAYTAKELDMSVTELGFVALSDKYLTPADEVKTEQNLGGAFSPERLKQAGLMLLQGMGMVFLVLAILWVVLIIFKNIFAKDAAKAERAQKAAEKAAKKQKKQAPTEVVRATTEATSAPVPPPASDDGALIAAITAAIAATIESDPALASQFVGGFRVVSFKKKTGKTSWNH